MAQQYSQEAYSQQPQGYGQPTQNYGQPSHGSGAFHPTDSGNFPNGSYQISQRDTNSILRVTLVQGGSIKSKPGAMFEMAGTIELKGKSKGFKGLVSEAGSGSKIPAVDVQ